MDSVQRFCEFILLEKQAARFDWKTLPVSPDRRRIFFASRALRSGIPEDAVCRVVKGAFGLDELIKCVRRDLNEGEYPLIATNDEYLVPAARQLQAHFQGQASPDLVSFRDKRVMKERVKQAGLRVPHSVDVADDEFDERKSLLDLASRNVGFPLVAKPASEANSRGVAVLDNASSLETWLSRYKFSGGALLEEHISGRLFFCDTLIEMDGMQTILMVCEYAHPPHLFSEGYTHGSRTLPREDPLFQRIADFNLKALSVLPRIRSTITHLEVFLTPNDELVFLEIAARAPGAWVARIGERHIGINLEELNFRLQLHLPCEVAEKELSYAAWLWFPLRSGTVKRLTPPEVTCQHCIEWAVLEGETCMNLPADGPNLPENAACRLEFWSDDCNIVEENFRTLKSFEPVTYVPTRSRSQKDIV